MNAPRRDGVFILRAAARSPERDDDERSSRGASGEDISDVLWSPTGSERPLDQAQRPLQLQIRPARLRDLLPLARMSSVLRLNQPDSALMPYRSGRNALQHLVRWRRDRSRVFIAAAAGGVVGFSEWQPVAPDRRWQLNALGSATGVYDAEPVWEELTRHATIAAGLSGVKRLYARIPLGSPAVEPVRAIGFAPYASETIFLARHVTSAPVGTEFRVQEQSDAWAIHQLYNSVVPKQVQFAEAWTSHRWDARTSNEPHGLQRRGWLVEDGHYVVGYVRVTSRGATHVIELLSAAERVDLIGPLLDTAIGRLREKSRVQRVYCTLRGYQGEAVNALAARGFDPLVEQDLYVKYTTAPARSPQPDLVPLHSEVIERLPKRVPSFLHGKPGDGAAG